MKRRPGARPHLTAEDIKAAEQEIAAKRAQYIALDREQRTAYVLREMNEAQERYFTAGEGEGEDRALEIDQDKRIVRNISIASDEPYLRWYGWEILDHSAGAVNLKRLNSGGAFMREHWGEQVGVCMKGKARVDGNKTRVDVLFSQRQEAKDELQDITDGIRCNTSLRYSIEEIRWEGTDENGEDIYRCTKWTPIHGASVSDPADFSVGFGKSLTTLAGATPKNLSGQPETAEVAKPGAARGSSPTVREGSNKSQKREHMRRKKSTKPAPGANEDLRVEDDELDLDDDLEPEIDYGARFKSIAKTAALGPVEEKRFLQIASDRSLQEEPDEAEFKKALLEDRKKHAKDHEPEPEDVETVAARNGGDRVEVVSRAGHLRHFKGKDAQKVAFRSGQFLLAAIFGNSRARQYCKDNGIKLRSEDRTHSESDNETGGFLVPDEFENVMIDLREEYGFFRRLANVVPMASETKSRPRRTGGLTAYPIAARGSGRAITASTKGWDRVSLVAKKWGVLTKYETELQEDAAIQLADDLVGEIAYAFAIAEDQAGFNGDGSSTYHGITGVLAKLKGLSGTIANIAGLQVGTGNAYNELTTADFIGVLARLPQYAAMRGPSWVCSRPFWANVMIRLTLAAGGVTAAEIEGARRPSFLGYPVEISQAMPQVEANSQVCCLFGVPSLGVMFGDRRGVTIRQTDSNDTDFEEDLISIKGTERFDINVHDVGNASGTANLRVPGPVVGLITAAS
jgi:HK97 family phage major capsid protein